jgi:glycosyltransferase involved in cell wall biosynthesis
MYRINLRLASALAVPHVGIADAVARDANVPVSEIAILPNGHPEQQAVGESSLGRELPARYVLFAGALAHWQGVGVMLEATRSPTWPGGLPLVVIGDGADVGLVEAALSPTVRYLGRRSPAEVAEALRGAVCSLSPKVLTEVTSSGISPFKVLEAGTQSTAVVATRVPGQAEYVDKYACGLLIEPGDAEELAHAVSKLYHDEDLARELGRNGRAASQDFRWENHAAELSRLVEPRQSPGGDAPRERGR